MKNLLIGVVALFFTGCVAGSQTGTVNNLEPISTEKGQPLYLAHGVWVTAKSGNQKCMNYKSGDLLPAGTEIYDAQTFSYDMDTDYPSPPNYISFKVKETDRKVTIKFEKNWHPGNVTADCFNKMFTDKTFDELTADMTETEKVAIGRGEIVEGMSKEAMLASFGHPPEIETPSLEHNEWIYWDTKFKRHKVCFGDDGRTMECKAEIKL